MVKSTKLLKRALALFLVVFISIESFAAVVSDNDGSAFITKAEFDSLKNNFQSQIDQYNTSIDSKIDGAIASYLSGIKMAKETSLDVLVDNYQDIRWRDNFFCKVKTRTFTTSTDYTDTSDYEIKVPEFYNQRGVKANTIAINDIAGYDEGYFSLTGLLSLDAGQDGIYNGGSNGYIEASIAINTLWINTKKNNETGQYVLNNYYMGPLCTEKYMNSRFESKPHRMTSGHWFVKGVGGWPTSKTAVTFYEPIGDIVLDWECPMYSSWTSTSGAGTTVRDKLLRGQSNFGALTMNDSGFMYNVVTASSVGTSMSGTLPIRGKSVNYWQDNNQASLDETNIYYFMAGNDADNIVNVGKYYELDGQTSCEWTIGESETVKVNGKFTNLTCMGGSGAPNDEKIFQNVTDSKYQNVKVNIPLWNRIKIKNLYSGLFLNKANNKYLALGEGLPILLNATSNGILSIKIKTTKLSGEYGSTTLASNNNRLTLKPNNFLLPSDALHGTLRGVDTIFDEVRLNKDEEYEIELNINKNDSVWLRLSPQNTISSVNNLDYAKIELLNLTFKIE